MDPQQPLLENLILQFQQQNANIASMQQALATALERQAAAVPPVVQPVVHVQSSSKPKHLERPPTYDGKDRAACSTFISSLKQYLRACPATDFPTEDSKINFAISYLRDDAFKWVEPYLETRDDPEKCDPMFATASKFFEALLKAKGDPDLKGTYTRKLYALRQTGSAASYTSEFHRLSAYLGWDDEALRAQYEVGLKPEIKDALALRESDPPTLQDLTAAVIKLDNRLYVRKEESRHSNKSSNPVRNPPNPVRNVSNASKGSRNSNSPSNSASKASNGPAPMDLDASKTRKFKPLTPQEKQYRRDNNLCMYCGTAGHRAAECPRKTTARISATLDPPAKSEN